MQYVDGQLVQAAPRSVTKLELMHRLSDAELAGIYAAAKTAVQIEVWLAESVDLDDPRTVAGFDGLEQAGLLAPGRAAEVLS